MRCYHKKYEENPRRDTRKVDDRAAHQGHNAEEIDNRAAWAIKNALILIFAFVILCAIAGNFR